MNVIVIILLNSSLFLINYYATAKYTPSTNKIDTENFYLEYLVQGQETDYIGSITKEKYASLCHHILQKVNINQTVKTELNKTAFYMKKPPFHLQQPIQLQYKLLLYNEIIPQKMYPCYGRHHVFGTNYKSDSSYNKYFISDGLHSDSFIVYIHVQSFDVERFYILGYAETAGLVNFKDISISAEEVRKELQLAMNYILVNNNPSMTESIYVREQNMLIDDPLCTSTSENLIRLCDFVFKHEFNVRNNFKATINWSAMHIYPVKCFFKYLTFTHWPRFKYEQITRQMIPCYSRHVSAPPNSALFDSYITHFYISSGPKPNSILLYVIEFDGSYSLLNLIENVPNKLKPMNIEVNQILKESPDIMNYIITYNMLKRITNKNLSSSDDTINKISEVSDQIWEEGFFEARGLTAKYLKDIKNLQELKSYYIKIKDSDRLTLFKSLQEMKEFLENNINKYPHEGLVRKFRELFAGENSVFESLEELKRTMKDAETESGESESNDKDSTENLQIVEIEESKGKSLLEMEEINVKEEEKDNEEKKFQKKPSNKKKKKKTKNQSKSRKR